jgi:hypothetical protein
MYMHGFLIVNSSKIAQIRDSLITIYRFILSFILFEFLSFLVFFIWGESRSRILVIVKFYYQHWRIVPLELSWCLMPFLYDA